MPHPLARALRVLLPLAALAIAEPAHAATLYDWINWAGGDATTNSNWNPAGYPHAGDTGYFNAPATFTTNWASPADTMSYLSITQGNPNFSIASHLGVANYVGIDGTSSLTISTGTLWASSLIAYESTLGDLAVVGLSSEVDCQSINWGSGAAGGASRIDVANGARLITRGSILLAYSTNTAFAGTVHTRVKSGIPARSYYPGIVTVAGSGASGDVTVGWLGNAALDLYDAGYMVVGGRLFVGAEPGAIGQLHLYPNGGLSPTLTVDSTTFIGANNVGPDAGGTGTLILEGSTAYFRYPVQLGDPDDPSGTPVQGVLQLDNGANTFFGGGISMAGALSGRFDVIGGNAHVLGGSVTIRQATPFQVGSSGSHSPQLWLENPAASDFWPAPGGGPALGIGRGGIGIVSAAGGGTALTVHGALVAGDSLGGQGTMFVDSTATLTVQGRSTLGAAGGAGLYVIHSGSVATLQDTVTVGQLVGTLTPPVSTLDAELGGVVHALKPALLGNQGIVLCYGGQMDIAGVTMVPGGQLELTQGGAVSVSDHLDLSAGGAAEVDSGGTLTYSNPAKPLVLGDRYGSMTLSNGSVSHIASELDVRGALLMQPYRSIVQQAASASSLRPAERVAALRTPARRDDSIVFPGPPARLESPLVRVLGTGFMEADGVIAGRFHIDSGTGSMQFTDGDHSFTGHGTLGDSTKTDGFVSVGSTTIGADTLTVLDSDGGDLGKMTLAGGVLQLPKPGHLKSGFVLSGFGTIVGSLDARDSSWTSFQGFLSGDLALAGTLDLGPGVAALVLGSFHPTATGRTTVKLAHSGADLILTTGAAALAGTLDLRSVPGDLPVIGDTLLVMTAGSFTGTFASVTFNGHPSAGIVHVLYRAGDVRVAVVGAVAGVDDGGPGPPTIPNELRFAASGPPRAAALVLDLPLAAHAGVHLFDVSGRQVAALADADFAAGSHRFELGARVGASGIYFARAIIVDRDGSHVRATRVAVLR